MGKIPMSNECGANPQIPTETLPTGAVRQQTAGRGRYELMSPFVLERDAQLYEWGADPMRRGLRNWEKGIPFSRCIQSILRHVKQYMAGENDPDHGDCLAAIRFWAGAIMHYEEMIRRGVLPASLNDMPNYAAISPLECHHSEVVERIYVAGPISADTEEETMKNYRRGQEVGVVLEKLGHLVFVPHNYVVRNHNQVRLPIHQYETLLKLDFSVIENWATAFYFIGSSPGADRELELAKRLGLKIFYSCSQVPDVT